jgi:uncharacterized protein (TIGR02246 family)
VRIRGTRRALGGINERAEGPMRTRLIGALSGVAFVAAISCTAPVVDLEEARRAIAEADRAWAAAAGARNLEGSVSAMADDGVMYPPDQPPVMGREAITRYMASAFAMPGFSVTWTTGDIHIGSGGDLAYSDSRSRYTVPDPAGTVRTVYAKGIAIWRRDPDGRWRCVADIWNSAPE